MPEPEKPKLDYIGKLTTVIPLLTLMVLVYGCIKQLVYYYNFNLNVFSFLDITELLPQTLFDLLVSAFYLAIAFVITVILMFYFGYKQNSKVNIDNNKKGIAYELILTKEQRKDWRDLKLKNMDEEWKVLKKQIPFAIILLIIIISFFVAILFKYYNDWTNFNNEASQGQILYESNIFLFYLALISLITTFTSLIFILFKSKTIWLNTLISISIFLAFSGFFEGRVKYLRVKKTHPYQHFTITVNKEKILSNKTEYYIGKTKGFVFFYNEKTNLVTVYPMTQISQMNIGIE